jgi:hypothetical protein
MAMEVIPLFAVQDAWNKLPIVNPGAVLTLYKGVEVKGVPENTSTGSHDVGGRSINVKNKVNRSGEQPLTPPSFLVWKQRQLQHRILWRDGLRLGRSQVMTLL